MPGRSGKDLWILRALKARVLAVKRDGTVWRPLRVKVDDGWIIYWRRQELQTHAATGRVFFQLEFEGQRKSVLVNRVVALRYLPNPDNHPEVNHLDGDKANNAVENLEWSSGSRNKQHAHETGLTTGRGSANSQARLDASAVSRIRAIANPDVRALAAHHCVSVATIRAILNRKTWTHVP